MHATCAGRSGGVGPDPLLTLCLMSAGHGRHLWVDDLRAAAAAQLTWRVSRSRAPQGAAGACADGLGLVTPGRSRASLEAVQAFPEDAADDSWARVAAEQGEELLAEGEAEGGEEEQRFRSAREVEEEAHAAMEAALVGRGERWGLECDLVGCGVMWWCDCV